MTIMTITVIISYSNDSIKVECKRRSHRASRRRYPWGTPRGWRDTVEIVLPEISNSTKPHASVLFSHIPVNWGSRYDMFLFEPNDLDELSNRIPPTSRTHNPARRKAGWSLARLCSSQHAAVGKGLMGLALMGSLQSSCFLTEGPFGYSR